MAPCEGGNLCLLLNIACHLAASQCNINIAIHGVLDNSLSSVNSRLLKRSKFNLKKREIIILKKAQNTEEYHTVKHSTILTNDPKHCTVADVKVYTMLAVIWEGERVIC